MWTLLAACAPPSPPDYTAPAAWAAHPDASDAADLAPPGFSDGQQGAAAAVFYVHPTTHAGLRDNGPIDDPALNARTDEVLRFQATALNAAGRIWAPRYRQAALHRFGDDPASEAAARLAYADVVAAYDRFLVEAGDRPKVLLGHSQGAMLLTWLLQERGAPDDLVVAYLVGEFVGADTFAGLPPCAAPDRTGCFASWATVREGASPQLACGAAGLSPCGAFTVHTTAPVCTNPLTWSDREASAADNPGSLPPDFGAPVPGLVGARCEGGLLLVDDAAVGHFAHTGGDYHESDVPLFWVALRDDAVSRVAAMGGAP